MNGILRNWESLCDIRPDCHHHFDASGTSNAMFDELAERSLMSPLAGTKHTYVRLAIIIFIVKFLHFFSNKRLRIKTKQYDSNTKQGNETANSLSFLKHVMTLIF